MQADIIIIGQGLSGTWLSWWLGEADRKVIVIDEGHSQTASRIASGVINPVTGRVLAKTWMAETLIPFAHEAYTALGKRLSINCINSVDILHAFPTQQMRAAFEKKFPIMPEHLAIPSSTEEWHNRMHAEFGFGIIYPALLIDLNFMLTNWQQYLIKEGRFLQERFNHSELIIKENNVVYKDIAADKIIFCDGVGSLDLPYFNKLPFTPNKGEALLVELEDLPANHIYKKGISLVPFPHFNQMANPRYFWAGSTYENIYDSPEPTKSFRDRTESQLRNWLKMPFKVLDHWAAIRPASVERRPFAGMHPLFPQVGILNGMGTKGCSLAPWLAKEFADHITMGSPINEEASINRFNRILGA